MNHIGQDVRLRVEHCDEEVLLNVHVLHAASMHDAVAEWLLQGEYTEEEHAEFRKTPGERGYAPF